MATATEMTTNGRVVDRSMLDEAHAQALGRVASLSETWPDPVHARLVPTEPVK